MSKAPSSKRNGLPAIVGKPLSAIILIAMLSPFTTLNAHTPYAQWDAYRTRHLQVLSSRSDLVGDAIADKWVAVLAEHLPKSKAVVSRARNLVRMASLLKTDQAKVAVLSHADAKAMFEGAPPFEDYGPMDLQVLVDDGAYLLVTRSDLPEGHGGLIVGALLDEEVALGVSVPEGGVFGMGVHVGAVGVANDH